MIDLSHVERIIERAGREPEAVVSILHAVQQQYRYLPEEALKRVCELTNITPAAITGVSTFYSGFRHRPVGEHVISVCHGTACHVKGAELVQDAVEKALDLQPGQDTDAAGRFTVQKVACLGCCTLAPVVQIDEAVYGTDTSHSPGSGCQVLDDFLRQQNQRASRSARAPRRNCRGRARSARFAWGWAPAVSCPAAAAKCTQAIRQTCSAESGRGGRGQTGRLRGNVSSDAAGRIDLRRKRSDSRLFSKVAAGRGAVDRARASSSLRPVSPDGFGYTVSAVGSIGCSSDEAGVTRLSGGTAIDVRDEPVCAFLGRQQHLATESLRADRPNSTWTRPSSSWRVRRR